MPVVAQPHGGALKRGGNYGNKGGGRTPESIRIKSRELFARWLELAEQQLKDPTTPAAVLVQIGNTLAKYGLGRTRTQVTTTGEDVPPPAPIVILVAEE